MSLKIIKAEDSILIRKSWSRAGGVFHLFLFVVFAWYFKGNYRNLFEFVHN